MVNVLVFAATRGAWLDQGRCIRACVDVHIVHEAIGEGVSWRLLGLLSVEDGLVAMLVHHLIVSLNHISLILIHGSIVVHVWLLLRIDRVFFGLVVIFCSFTPL